MSYFNKMSISKMLYFLFLLLILILGFQLAVKAGWDAPTAEPPGANKPEPIDVGGESQEKTGDLILQGTLTVDNLSVFNALSLFNQGMFALPNVSGWSGYFYNSPVGIESSLAVGYDEGGYLVVGAKEADIAHIPYTGDGDAYFYDDVGIADDLHVAPGGGGAGQICLDGTDTEDCISEWADLGSVYWTEAQLANDIRSLNTGNVGIGTLNPTYKLTVVGNLYASYNHLTDNNYGFNWGDSNTRMVGSSADRRIQFYTNDNEQLRITSEGHVGIGSTTPDELLTVYSTSDHAVVSAESTSDNKRPAFILKNDLGYRAGMFFYGSNSPYGYNKDLRIQLDSTDSDIHFTDMDGVGINVGDVDVPAKLTVKTSATKDILNLIETDGKEVFTVLENGQVGIGLSDPAYKLDVRGWANASDGLCINGDCISEWSDSGAKSIGLMPDNPGLQFGVPIDSIDEGEAQFMAYDGADIWISASNVGSGSAVYKMQYGSDVAKKITSGLESAEGARGITYDGQWYWLAVNGTVGTSDGGLYNSQDGGVTFQEYNPINSPFDILFTGKFFVISRHKYELDVSKMIVIKNPHLGSSGSTEYTVNEWITDSVAPYGLLYDGEYIWYTTRHLGGEASFGHERNIGRLSIDSEGNLSNAGYYDISGATPCGPRFMAFDGNNVWVTCIEDNSLKKISTESGTEGDVLGTYPLSVGWEGANDIIFDGKDLWIGTLWTNKIFRFKPELEQFVNCDGSIPAGDSEGCYAADPYSTELNGLLFDGTYIYSAHGDGKVSKVYSGKGFGYHMPDVIEQLTVGKEIMVGSNSLELENLENLIYGNLSESSLGNLLLLQKAGNDKLRILYNGAMILDPDPNGYFLNYGQSKLQGGLMVGTNYFVVESGENLVYGNMDASSEGNLLLLQNETVDMFTVDQDGNLSLAGDITVDSYLNMVGNIRSDGLVIFNNHEYDNPLEDDRFSVIGEGADYNLLNLYHYYFEGEDFWNSRFSVNHEGQIMIGSDRSVVNNIENLIYGNMDTTSLGNLLLLQKEGVDMFTIDDDGNVLMEGDLRMDENSIKLGPGSSGPTIEASGGNVIIRLGG